MFYVALRSYWPLRSVLARTATGTGNRIPKTVLLTSEVQDTSTRERQRSSCFSLDFESRTARASRPARRGGAVGCELGGAVKRSVVTLWDCVCSTFTVIFPPVRSKK